LQDSGRQIGAASDWLGQNDFGCFAGHQALGGSGKFRKPAAETPSGDLLRWKAGRFCGARVDKLPALIVQDDANTLARSAQPRTRRE
jgi:hypothetical protein